jgi:adenine phosphoribosyltransferase
MDINQHIRKIPDFPKPGIMFMDITTLLENPAAFQETVDRIYDKVKDLKIDKVVGVESRGFILAGVLAYRLGAGCVLVRKPGKLPSTTLSCSYDLEYGSATVEMHDDSVRPGEKVLLVDDLLATGGTMEATIKLVKRLGGEIAQIAFIIELGFLPGRKKLEPYPVFSLLCIDGEE